MSRQEDKYDIERVIKVLRNSGEEPTIPGSDFKSDGTWLTTDVYRGQVDINIEDDKAWYRQNSGITEFITDTNISSYASNIYSHNSILVSTDWDGSNEQEISISGGTLTTTSTIWVSPLNNRTDTDNYSTSEIICIGNSTTGLTFECKTIPTENIDIIITIAW